MEWDKDAEQLIERAPALFRPLARRRVEQFARKQGAARVTRALAEEAYARLRGGGDQALKPTPELIERLEAEAESLDRDSRFRARQYQVRPCAGAVGCPRTLIDVERLAEAVAGAIARSGFPEFLERGLGDRPILSHHRFKAAIAGCPNACSQPQISDFGVIGASAIDVSAELCTGCLACVKACREGAIAVDDRMPVLDFSRCIECGDCARACAAGALTLGQRRYRVLVGGQLGRHPRLAVEVATAADEREVLEWLDRVLRALIGRGKPGERVAALIGREGMGVIGGVEGEGE